MYNFCSQPFSYILITHYKEEFFLTDLKLHFTRKETNQYDKLQAMSLLKVIPKYSESYAQQLHTNNILFTEEYGLRKGILTENAKFR